MSRNVAILSFTLLVAYQSIACEQMSADEQQPDAPNKSVESDRLFEDLSAAIRTDNFELLKATIQKLFAADIGTNEPRLMYLYGLAHLRTGEPREGQRWLQRYLRSNDEKFRRNANQLIEEATLKLPPIVNSIGMKLVLVPAGEYLMGESEPVSQIQRLFDEPKTDFSDEYPLHRVKIPRSFYVGQHEVTIRQFRQFVEATGHRTDAEKAGAAGGFDPNAAAVIKGSLESRSWRYKDTDETDDHPVRYVSWNDANAFLRWLNQKEDAHYRLPTEAEWEYFARAGTTTRYWTGNSPATLAQSANVPDRKYRESERDHELTYATLDSSDGYAGTAPVGKFKPNPFRLYDIHGNVWEWCYDGYDPTAYRNSRESNPFTPPDSSKLRVMRGGCYM